jgi:pSer/pThr/pTyr-binding forkhead associated (FHA) protein
MPAASAFPPARSETNARLCGRCFARNLAGETYCKVCGEPLPEQSANLEAAVTRRTAAPAVRAVITIHVDYGDGAEYEIPIDRDVSLVGRESAADNVHPDIDLAPFDLGNYVSRRHAFIVRRHGSFLIEDLDSANGTGLNGSMRLVPHTPTTLKNGDKITFGNTKVTFTTEAVPRAGSPL